MRRCQFGIVQATDILPMDRVDFAVKDLKNKNPNDIRIRYENEVSNIDYRYFNEFKDRFIKLTEAVTNL